MVLLWYLYRIFMVFIWYFLPTQNEGKAKARHLKTYQHNRCRSYRPHSAYIDKYNSPIGLPF